MNAKKFIGCLLVAMSFMLTSCYSTKLYVGEVEKTDPVVKVQSEWNHNLLYGLIPIGNNKLDTSEYVKNKSDFMVRTNMTFVDLLISAVTFGIYTPTHTTFYLPIPDMTE